MRTKPGKDGLTVQQRAFTAAYARSGDPAYAATKAGYAHPDTYGHDLLKKPVVQASVREAQARRMVNDLLPLAVDLLEHVIKDKTAKTADRLRAGKIVTDYGFGAHAARDKAPEDMTPDELADRIAALRARQAALAEGAKIIDIEPESDVFG